MKKVKAVQPYIYPNQLNFKNKPFEAWMEVTVNGYEDPLPTSPVKGEGRLRRVAGRTLGNEVVRGWYPRLLHGLMFKFDLPTLWHGEARLCFVQPVSLYFDTFFTALTHEVIPFIWDCWPCYYDKMERWMKRHKVRTAIFTSKQEMEEMQKICPEVKMMWCPEAVDTTIYKEGKELKDRSIDLLEFGRGLALNVNDRKLTVNFSKINHVKTLVDGKFLYSDEQLYDAMGDAKVTICLPRSITHPDMAEGVETLTQRYWEAMLSRMVIVGHCPKELEELIGYNPVVEMEALNDNLNPNLNPNPNLNDNPNERRGKGADNGRQILNIIAHIEDYQELVDRNREVAFRMGDWKGRMKEVMEWLGKVGYEV